DALPISQFWTFIYLKLARLVGSERHLICEKQANIGQFNATTYLVSLSLSRENTVVNGPELNAIPQNYQMPHEPLHKPLRVRRADTSLRLRALAGRVCKSRCV